jgi:hypothetical protein
VETIAGWCQQLKDTFGTSSTDFASIEMDRLVSTLGLQNGQPLEAKINAALAAMTAAQPKDEMEAMLASQIVATHSLIMDLLGLTKRAGELQLLEAYGGLANRLMRAYAIQTEAFAKLRRGGEQVVRVEHVHVYSGGQALVGNVRRGGGGEG